MTAPWPAPRATAPVDAVVGVPGSKSVTNRALVLAALADGPSRLRRPLRARDTELMAAALRTLGTGIAADGPDGCDWLVTPGPLRGGGSVDVGLAGTVHRFVPPLAALADGPVHFDGDPRARLRPLAPLLDGLRQLGAEVDGTGLPLWVTPGPLRGGELEVPPDLSSAAPFVAAAVATGGRVVVPGWPRHCDQPGSRLPELLRAMGAGSVVEDRGLVTTAGDELVGLDADLSDCTELVPALVALAALASTESHLSGIAHMRGHETDRLRALSAELTRLGGECHETPDGLRVVPRRLHGGVVQTYDDHRMAMFAAVLGLAVDGVAVENVATTGKTLPDFVDRWTGMLGTAPAGAPR